MAEWTLDSLERACRKVLMTRSDLKLASLPPGLQADVTYGSQTRAKIRVDNDKVGMVVGVVHELLHVVLDEDLKNFEHEVEEPIIVALEAVLAERITSSRRRYAWWRKAIAQKLPKDKRKAMFQTRRKSQDGYSTAGFWRERDTPKGSE